jgi:hypothetical protein
MDQWLEWINQQVEIRKTHVEQHPVAGGRTHDHHHHEHEEATT